MKEKDYSIIGYFRSNARMSLTKLSKATKIPVSTLFDKLRDYENRKIIQKHTAIIDFKKLGYDIKLQILLAVEKERKESLQKFLYRHPRVNTILRINNGYDYMIEAIFKNMEELDEFTRNLEEHEPKDKKELYIMEDIKREEFLTHKENLGLIR